MYTKEKEISIAMNNFFINIIKILDLKPYKKLNLADISLIT